MWLLVCVVSHLVEGLQSRRGLVTLLYDVAPSVCPFWFSRGLAGDERAVLSGLMETL